MLEPKRDDSEESSDFSSDGSEEEETGTGTTETETETEDSSEGDYTSDSEEEEANRKAGVPSDPMKKRVPQSFYDEEAKKLGPLPKPWEIAYSGKKPFFVNHATKMTSWVDPRTERTRVPDITKCKVGELPYGWDEEVDPEIGVYYIDHNTQSTFLDPPWDPRIQFQVAQLMRFLAEQIALLTKKIKQEENQEEEVKKRLSSDSEQLEETKKKLEKEIAELRKKSDELKRESGVSTSDPDSENEVDVGKLPSNPETLEEFRERIRELARLQDLLLKGPGENELDQYKEAQEEIQRVQELLKKEEETRDLILKEIEEIKRQLSGANLSPATSNMILHGQSTSPEARTRPAYEREEVDDIPARKIQTAEEIFQQPIRKAQLTRKTIYEMQMELMALHKKLREEKLANETRGVVLDHSKKREGNLPPWIKKMDDIVNSSKTLRVKIREKAKAGGENLSFRERMLFFAAQAAEGR